jgi:YggT family protein
MGANGANAVFFLVTTLLDLAIWIWLLRILLQAARADFYNPISQFIWQATRYPTDALQRLLPPWRNLNLAAALGLLLIAVIHVHAVCALLALPVGALASVWYALLKITVMAVNLLTFTLFVQAILSWLGPGVNNPASNILWSLNEPLLRPVRRVLPVMSGLDLSPLLLILVLQVVNRLLPLPGVFR